MPGPARDVDEAPPLGAAINSSDRKKKKERQYHGQPVNWMSSTQMSNG